MFLDEAGKNNLAMMQEKCWSYGYLIGWYFKYSTIVVEGLWPQNVNVNEGYQKSDIICYLPDSRSNKITMTAYGRSG